MGKPKKTTGDRVSTTAKAGKKSGSYQEPPRQNPEKKRASELGQQQFYSDKQFTQPVIKTVYNKKTKQFEEKIIHETIPFIFDETRKQFVYSNRKESD